MLIVIPFKLCALFLNGITYCWNKPGGGHYEKEGRVILYSFSGTWDNWGLSIVFGAWGSLAISEN